MNTGRFGGLILPILLLLSLVLGHAGPAAPQSRRAFEFQEGGITFDTQFDGARLNQIRQTGPAAFTMTIEPENQPVNDSAWYAFRARARTNVSVQIMLEYAGGSHRYTPKVSTNGSGWISLQGEAGLKETGTNCTFEIPLTPAPLYVSGQELFTTEHFNRWMDALGRYPFVSRRVIGKSTLGRPIELLEISEAPANAEVVIVIGRQHPPEVTGTFALTSFIETLCGHTSGMQKFREKFRVIAVPFANPDGVDSGFWRHNVNGVDLNRDWGPFAQAETRVIRDELVRLVAEKNLRVRFGFDFHSTKQDLLYTGSMLLPEDPTGAWWLSSFRQLTAGQAIPAFGDAGRETTAEPARTRVCAAWLKAQFKAPGVTFETGDRTDRAEIRTVASAAAIALCETLLPASIGAPAPTPEAALRVALYTGPGVSGKGPVRITEWFSTNAHVRIASISPEAIRRNELDGYAAIIFPGGGASTQAEAIGVEGRAHIRAFTSKGGAYIGICAGAYLACSGFSWGVQVLDAKTASNKWQRGAGSVLLELTRSGASVLQSGYGSRAVKYENGPILVPAGNPEIPDFMPWGVFASELANNDTPKGIMTGSPAIVAGTYGGGRVVCFSPHPEQTPGLEALVERAIYWATEKKAVVAAGK